MKITDGNWSVIKEKMHKLPHIHVISDKKSDAGKHTYLASVHQTYDGEEFDNANLFAAARDMYEAITIGLTGMDLQGNVVNQEDAIKRLTKAKEKAEGK